MEGVCLDGKEDKSARLWCQGKYSQNQEEPMQEILLRGSFFDQSEPKGRTWDERASYVVLYFSSFLHAAVLMYFAFSCYYLVDRVGTVGAPCISSSVQLLYHLQ